MSTKRKNEIREELDEIMYELDFTKSDWENNDVAMELKGFAAKIEELMFEFENEYDEEEEQRRIEVEEDEWRLEQEELEKQNKGQ